MSSRSGALGWAGFNRRLLALTREKPLTLARSQEQPSKERLLIVGNGMVGQRFCESLLRFGGEQRFTITVLGEEATPAYDRVHLTDIWHGRDPKELVLRDPDWYARHSVELRLGERVLEVDRAKRQVTTVRGSTHCYDRLVLATGSHVVPLDLGDDSGGLLNYRTIEDAQRILAEVKRAGEASVIVVGAGLLGLEAARALQRLKCRVTVLEASSQVLPRQLDPTAADVLSGLLTEAGLEIRTRARISRIEADPGGQRVFLENGEELSARVVVAAVGVRASDQVGRAAGLTCELRGGIRVDDELRTSDPRVYAIGECAHHPRVPHGLVAPGYAMADVLAKCLLGKPGRLGVQEAITRLKLDLTEVTVLGNPLTQEAGDDWVWQGPGCYRRLVVNNRRITAALSIGLFPDLPTLQRLITEHRRVSSKTLEKFAETGELSGAGRVLDVHTLSDAELVCNCANVSCGTLRQAVARGEASVEALGRATAAGTLCGSCQPLLSELCGSKVGAGLRVPARTAFAPRAMLFVSTAAVTLALVTLLLPRVPLVQSVRLQGIDVLWVDSFYKQVSGFVLLGTILVGLSLSLRKRVKRFRFGEYANWRVLHTALGLSALAVLFGHTGFRLGYNLNQVLMLVFLVSAVTGGLSGVLMAKAGSAPLGSAVGRGLRIARVLHDWALWPLLVLVGFHVLKVYYF